MNITFRLPRRRDSKILAFADVTVVEGIIVKGFRVVNGSKGVFAAVPSKRGAPARSHPGWTGLPVTRKPADAPNLPLPRRQVSDRGCADRRGRPPHGRRRLRLPPPVGDLLLGYLGCFRPARYALGW